MKKIYILVLFAFTTCKVLAQTDAEISEQCKLEFPKVTQFFKRNECVAEAKKRIAEARANERRENEARPCLAKQIPDMESKIKALIKDISPADSLDEAAKKMVKVTGRKSDIQPSETNIKNMVAINTLHTSCKSEFYYLINIVQGEDGKLSNFKVWAENPPKGYAVKSLNGYLPEFFVDFVQRRKIIEENSRLSAKKEIKSSSDYINPKSHCAPNIPMKERISRLSIHGEVLQSSERTYRAGSHSVGFHYDGSLSFCY